MDAITEKTRIRLIRLRRRLLLAGDVARQSAVERSAVGFAQTGPAIGFGVTLEMTCPHCCKPMNSNSTRMFVCEPCRERIIVFTVVSKFKPPVK